MKDRISQLMDGELDDAAAAATIELLKRDPEAAQAWRDYHLARDALGGTAPLSEGFAARMAQRLGAEPVVLAPARRAEAANDRRWLPAAAAAAAAVGLVGWLAFAPQPQTPAPQVAQAPQAVAPEMGLEKKQSVTPIPVSANDYLLAHQGFSPRVSLQGMAPYVRTVSTER
jgi:sigma-E factor negative regulatory protein RseA